MSQILILAVFLIMLGITSSFYNQSYDGVTFILPDIVLAGSDSSKLMERSFSDAQDWCKKNVNGSTLATIPNKDVQQNFTHFIIRVLHDKKPIIVNNQISFRLNGNYHITDEWRWVNGHPNKGITILRRNDDLFSFYALTTNLSIYSENSNKTSRFICEYTNNQGKCDFFSNGRCYKKKNKPRTWYGGRNVCVDEGGDLASFETFNNTSINATLQKLADDGFWIGMQKNEWRWSDTGSAIRFTNWEDNRPSNNSLQCLCLVRPQSKWRECDCSQPYPFICSFNETRNSSTLEPLNGTAAFVITAVACGSIFVIVIIVATVLIAKKQRNNDTLRGVKSSGHENPEYALIETSNDFALYDKIQEPKETNCTSNTTYASVQPAATTDEELPINNTVYADLDLSSKA